MGQAPHGGWRGGWAGRPVRRGTGDAPDFERYQGALPPKNIVRCEDICATNGRASSGFVPAAELDEPLEGRNFNPLYKRGKVLRFGEKNGFQ